jgi:hypothetical protein
MTDAEKHQLEKERLQREKQAQDEKKAFELANNAKDKIKQQGRPRSTNEFLNDQALWEHKKLTELQNAIIQKEQQTQDEEKKHGFKPELDRKSVMIAQKMGLDTRVESRLGNKSYRNQRFNA